MVSTRIFTRFGGLAVVLGLMLGSPALGLTVQEAKQEQSADVGEADRLFRAEDWAAAAKAYEAITKLEPRNGRAWFRLSYALHAAGELDRAIVTHQKTAEFPRFRATALYNLACAHALKGKTDDAFAALQEAVQAGFANRRQLETDTDLTTIRSDARFKRVLARLKSSAPLHRQFDFWVGDWNVLDTQGKLIGTNRIDKLEKGFLILENWTSAGGGTGKSINYVDPADGKWKQVWVSGSGGVVYYEGEFRDGAMRFTGSYNPPRGTKEMARASFTPLSDGRVRQFIEHSKDGGKTWSVYFDGTYVRKGAEKAGRTEKQSEGA